MGKEILVKVHKSYRWVVAICDKELLGRNLEDGERQLDLSTKFFDGEAVDSEELDEKVERGMGEDATFYIVGEKSIEFMLRKGLIERDGVKKIEGVPFALVLL